MRHLLQRASLPLVIGLAAAAALSSPAAHAQVFSTGTYQTGTNVASYTGTTVGGPTFNRPNANGTLAPTALSTTATAVAYSAFNFTAPTTTSYNFLSTSTATPTFDNFTILYAGAFNPASPLTNAIIANDDFPGIGLSGFNGVALTAGNAYTLVTTGFSNTASGTFSNSITIPANNPTAVAIPDANVAGISTTLNVASSFTIGSLNSITIQGLSHTYVGDLVITLTHNGTTVELVDRVGAVAAGDFGNGADLLDANSYTFALGGTPFPTTGASIPTGPYAPFANGTAGQSSTATGTFADFAGQNANGAWTVSISDRASGDTGAWRGLFSINLTAVTGAAAPEPGTFALLAAGLPALGAVVIRRRRRAK